MKGNEALQCSGRGQSSCAEFWNAEETYVPQLDKALLESNQLLGLRVGAGGGLDNEGQTPREAASG